MNAKKLITSLAAGTLSIGLCLASASIANAETKYAVSSGSFNYGYYQGSWDVQVSRSWVKTLGWGEKRQFCEAVQDGASYYATAGAGGYCIAEKIGAGTLANQDYVIYYQY